MKTVELVYDFAHETYKEFDEQIRKVAGNPSGAGAGFGQRDHAWYGLSEEEAIEKAEKLKALDIPGLEVWVEDDPPEVEE